MKHSGRSPLTFEETRRFERRSTHLLVGNDKVKFLSFHSKHALGDLHSYTKQISNYCRFKFGNQNASSVFRNKEKKCHLVRPRVQGEVGGHGLGVEDMTDVTD